MRPFLKILALFAILASFQSCRKVIEIDIPPAEPKVVVNSFFTDGSKIKAHISQSIGILENNVPVCTDATVVLREDNIIIDTMYYQSEYYYSHIPAKINKHYALEVKVPGMKTVYCDDLIPQKTILQNFVCTDTVLINQDGFIINELRLDFNDFPGPSYYEVQLSATDTVDPHNMTGIWFMNNTDPVITSTGLLDYNPRTLIFSDKLFDGKSCTLKICFSYGWPRNFILKLHFRSVSESYYKYRERQVAYLFSLENDIFSGMSEPINLYSNVRGGYGIFAGYSSDEKVISAAGR